MKEIGRSLDCPPKGKMRRYSVITLVFFLYWCDKGSDIVIDECYESLGTGRLRVGLVLIGFNQMFTSSLQVFRVLRRCYRLGISWCQVLVLCGCAQLVKQA